VILKILVFLSTMLIAGTSLANKPALIVSGGYTDFAIDSILTLPPELALDENNLNSGPMLALGVAVDLSAAWSFEVGYEYYRATATGHVGEAGVAIDIPLHTVKVGPVWGSHLSKKFRLGFGLGLGWRFVDAVVAVVAPQGGGRRVTENKTQMVLEGRIIGEYKLKTNFSLQASLGSRKISREWPSLFDDDSPPLEFSDFGLFGQIGIKWQLPGGTNGQQSSQDMGL